MPKKDIGKKSRSLVVPLS